MKRHCRRPLVGVVAGFLALTLVVAACGGDDDSEGTGGGGTTAGSSQAPAEESVDRSAELRFAINYTFSALDPHKSRGGGDQPWLQQVYDSLLTVVKGPDGLELGPQLATSFEVADDGRSITWELRDDVTFQDGTPFNAEAVKANVERAKGPESTVQAFVAAIESVEVVDDTHAVFHLSEPDPTIPWVMGVNSVGNMISPAAFSSDLGRMPVGSGPFKLVSAQEGGDVVYERWEDHWDKDAALVQRLTLSTVGDPNARFNGIRTGSYHAGYLGGGSQDLEARTLPKDGYQYILNSEPNPLGVMLNSSMPPFDDVRVRRAVWLAIDRQQISENLLNGLRPPAYQNFQEGFLGYDKSLEEDPLDAEEARRLVQEAGAAGASVNLLFQQNPPIDGVAEVVQQALNDIGLDVTLQPISPTEGQSAWQRGGTQAFVAGYPAQPEPSQTLAQSFLATWNPAPPPEELVKMAAEAKVMPVGSEDRKAAFEEINRWLVENPVHVPIVWSTTTFLVRPEVVNTETMVVMTIGQLDFRGVGIADA